MMKKWFITYSNELFAQTREYSLKMAKRVGEFDKVIRYTPDDIDVIFRKQNKEILELSAGNGLWLWKPYFICKTLEQMREGDVIVYCDAGSFFIKSSQYIIESMKNKDVWVSDIPLIEKQFTNPALFKLMGCDGEKYSETNQVQANFVALRKSEYSMHFANVWLQWCKRPDCIIPEKNVQLEGFKFEGHRSDQSILSLLSKKYNVGIHLDPTQYGRVPEKYYESERIFKIPDHKREYPVSIILHRTKNLDKKIIFKQWLCSWLPKTMVVAISNSAKQFVRAKK